MFFIHSDISHGYKNVQNIEYINVMFHPDQLLQLPELKLLPGFQALFYLEPFFRKEMYFKGMLSLQPAQLEELLFCWTGFWRSMTGSLTATG